MKKILVIFLVGAFAQFFAQENHSRGLVLPTDKELIAQKVVKSKYIGSGNSLYKMTKSVYGDANASSFDLRDLNAVTPVKDQGNCGSCWAFAAVASLESSIALNHNKLVDLSEQDVLSCSEPGDCRGGWYGIVFERLMRDPYAKISLEKDNPYTASDASCITANNGYDFQVINYGQLDSVTDLVNYNNSIRDLKEAVTKHGAVSIALNSNNPEFMNYQGNGVIRGYEYGKQDHAVVLIGWDDSKQAWLIKNSWGDTYWGDRGYGWLGYNSCNVGYGVWVDVAPKDEPAPKPVVEDGSIIKIVDQLGKNQSYQEIFVKIGNEKPFKFFMNKKGKRYNNYIPVKNGKHRIQIVTKTVIQKKGKKAMVFGVLKGRLNVTGNKAFKLKYSKRIKKNIYDLELVD